MMYESRPYYPVGYKTQDARFVELDGMTQATISNPLYEFSIGATLTFQGSSGPPRLSDWSSFGKRAIFNDTPVSTTLNLLADRL